MINNNQEFFKLLKYSNELRKNNKSLFKENPEKSRKLSRFFIAKYDKTSQTFREIKQDFEQKFDKLSNLLIENKNKKYQIGMSLMSIYDHWESNGVFSTTSDRLAAISSSASITLSSCSLNLLI